MNIKLEALYSEIVIGEISKFHAAFKDLHSIYTKVFIITDENVAPKWLKIVQDQVEKAGNKSTSHSVPAGETSKSLFQASVCWEEMHKQALDRKSLVIGLGGGVITDLSGFVASTYMRGVDVIQIPTTLMGMVDASIGGKTAVNLSTGKNIVGTLFQPRIIFVDPQFLKSLPAKEYRSGLAEVIKYGVIWDSELFQFLEKSMPDVLALKSIPLNKLITTSCKIKAEVVSKDPTEQNLRAILNFGHTFAHAIETATAYKKYLHGEAVAIGMSCAATLSHSMSLCSKKVVERINSLCHQAGLKTELPSDIPLEKIVELMAFDKKSIQGDLNLILVQEIGKVTKVNGVDPKTVLLGLKTKQALDQNA